MGAAAPPRSRWLFGPVPDLLFGCGLLYVLLLGASGVARPEIRALQPAYLLPFLIILFSMPHYGATLVRVYERRADRRRYFWFSVVWTIAVAVAFLVGLHDVFFGSLLLTTYFTWSPWHYTGQNYGLAVMFLRRRGVVVTPTAKRLLYTSFILSFALVVLLLHIAGGSGYAAAGERYQMVRLGIQQDATRVLFPLVAGAQLATLAVAGFLLWRGATSVRDLGPAAMLALTQAVWFSLPYAALYAAGFFGVTTGFEPFDAYASVGDYVLWLAVGHGVQYIWVTCYYARGSPGWQGYASYFGKILAAGVAIWTLPVILFGPDALGPRAYGAGLFLMLTSAINIHHFILDGAIWKLRDSRIANILIRREEPVAEDTGERARPAWRRAAWATAAAGLVIALFVFWEEEVDYPRRLARGDYAAASAVLDRVAWVGRDDAAKRATLGRAAAGKGDLPLALHQYERAAALGPSAAALGDLGALHAMRQDWQAALAAYEDGVRLVADDPRLLLGAARAALALGDPGRALVHLEPLLAQQPANPELHAAVEESRRLLAQQGASGGAGTTSP